MDLVAIDSNTTAVDSIRLEAHPDCARIRNLQLAFGGHVVLDDLSIDFKSGEIVLLRGDNGSGKTALFNILSGFLPPAGGSVNLNLRGRWVEATRTAPETLAAMGLGRLWQDIRLFPNLSVLDNVLAATPGLTGANPLIAVVGWTFVREQERRARQRALENLAEMGMADRAGSTCGRLSLGQMKRVALARLLQMDATLLLLDEPFAGLDGGAADSLAEDIRRLRDHFGRTLVVVEHRYEVVMEMADRVIHLRNGALVESRNGRG